MYLVKTKSGGRKRTGGTDSPISGDFHYRPRSVIYAWETVRTSLRLPFLSTRREDLSDHEEYCFDWLRNAERVFCDEWTGRMTDRPYDVSELIQSPDSRQANNRRH